MAIFALGGLALGVGNLALGAGNLALSLGKGILGAGKKKGSGAKMASSIVKREPQEQQSKIKVKTKVVSVSNLMNTKSLESQDRKKSKKSSGVESIDGALDSIDNTLAGIIGTIKDTSTLQQQSIKRKNRRKVKIKKDEREEGLESKGSVPKFGMKIPRPFRGAFDAIKNFFSNVIIGALIIGVLDNINKIVIGIRNVYTKIKEVVTKVGEFLTPVWNIFKWIVEGFSPSGLDLVRAILADKNTQDLMDERKINEIKEESDKVVEETKRLEGLFQNIEKDANIELEPEDDREIAMNDVPPPPPVEVRSAESSSIWDNIGKFFSGIGNAVSGGDKKSTNSSVSGSGSSSSVSGSGSSTGGEIGKLLDTIAFAEGTADKPNNGYNTIYGGGQIDDLSKHPDKVVRGGQGSPNSSAFGRYQFMPGTWDSVGGGAMTPARQDWGATRLILMRLGLPQTKAGAAQLEEMLKKGGLTTEIVDALAPEWASFPNLIGPDAQGRVGTNTSYYGQGGKTLEDLQSRFRGSGSAGILGNQSNINANLSQKIASLMTTPSYATPGGTTIIAMSDGDQASPTPSQGSSSPMIIPIGPSRKDVVLNNYEFSVNNALWKIG
jgi:muramidase (phage lysozyme)